MWMRKLGFSELELTTIGLGTWAIGGPWQFGWGPQNDKDSLSAIFEAVDAGINWIDTAAVYGCGHSEEMVGKALKEMREQPIIATKCGLFCGQQRQRVACLKKESIIKQCENSLRRLGIEAIDLYQIHRPEPDEDIEQGWAAIAELIKQGKVRYGGVSNFNVEQIKRCQQIHPVASLQPSYSMIHREVEEQLLRFCAENYIGVVAYSPIGRGLLTGKFTRQRLASLPADDHRRENADFQEPAFSATLKMVDELKPIAQRNGKTVIQLAIAWVLRQPEVTSAIVGARRAGQISESVPAGDWQLSDEDIAEIEELLKQRNENG